MAHSPARTGTVSVRLRRAPARVATHPAVRRLLVVAGLALAGWLFGGTAPASAATTLGQQARVSSESSNDLRSPMAGRPVSLKGQPAPSSVGAAPTQDLVGAGPKARAAGAAGFAGKARTAGPTGGFVAKARAAGATGFVATARTAVREALATRPGLSVGMPGLGVLPGKAKQIAQDGTPTDALVGRVSWAPRHRVSAVAISGVSRGGHPEGRLGSLASHTHPAPQADSAGSQPLPEADALLPAGGGAALGGASGGGIGGHLETGGPLPGFRPALTPVLGKVSPAVRTAADEPSFAPD